MSNIPTVKQWLITTENGDSTIVLAPTRRLARLSYIEQYGYLRLKIKSIGVINNT